MVKRNLKRRVDHNTILRPFYIVKTSGININKIYNFNLDLTSNTSINLLSDFINLYLINNQRNHNYFELLLIQQIPF